MPLLTFSATNHKRLTIIAIVLFSCLYLGLSAKTAVNVADSDDLSLATYFHSLAHPPGYQLLTALSLPATVVSAPQFAAALHAINAVIMAASLGIFFLVVTKLLQPLIPKPALTVIAVLATCWWGLNRLTYQNAVMYEAFALATLLLLTTILTSLSIDRVKNQARVIASLGLGMLTSLTFFAHQLTAPFLVLWLIPLITRKKIESRWFVLACGLSLVALLGSYRLFFNQVTDFGWFIHPSQQGVIDFFLRLTLADGGSAIEAYATKIDLQHTWFSLIQFIKLLTSQGGYLLPIMAAAGWWCYRQSPKSPHVRSLVQIILVYTLIFGFYLKFPQPHQVESDTQLFWGTHLTERMLFVVSLGCHLLAAYGLAATYHLLTSVSFRSIKKSAVYCLTGLAMVSFFGFKLYHNYHYQAFNTSSFSSQYSRYLLEVLPDQAVVLVDTDIVFGLLYQQLVQGIRSDVAIVPQVIGMRGSWFEQQQDQLFQDQTGDNTTQAAEIVRFSLSQQRPVFLYQPSDELLSLLSAQGLIYLSPYHFWLRVDRSIYPPQPADETFANILLSYDAKQASFWLKGWRGHLATHYAMQAYYSGKLGYEQLARQAASWGDRLAHLLQTKAVVQASLEAGLAENE